MKEKWKFNISLFRIMESKPYHYLLKDSENPSVTISEIRMFNINGESKESSKKQAFEQAPISLHFQDPNLQRINVTSKIIINPRQ